ncbi:MAG TPA: MgtC/SapB family protein [Acidobacteriota bacterium]|jgi:putative Mg2+ transporter-C (MgtC) family protein
MNLALSVILRIVSATGLGGIVGIERTLRHKPAGLRTNMLIAMGSALFTVLSLELGRDTHEPTRIMAQIITGIGFIGGGAILRSGLTVTGLTTAATIFVVAGIGMAVGAGYYWIGLVSTIFILVTLYFLGKLEYRITTIRQAHVYTLSTSRLSEASVLLSTILDQLGIRPEDLSSERKGEEHCLHFTVHTSPERNRSLMQKLLELKEIDDIKATVEPPS